MIGKKYWIALFSQTGSEIANISKALKVEPDLVLTNNLHGNIVPQLADARRMTHVNIMQMLKTMHEADKTFAYKNVVITLHGYLRIIPDDLTELFEIYNGHPAAIHLFPELKGKDPQLKTWQDREKYTTIGSVVHKVTPFVDEGPILTYNTCLNDCSSLDDMFIKLKTTSLNAWLKFLRDKV